MRAPQIIVITLYAINLLFTAYMHGKPKIGRENFWTALIGNACGVGLLIWGGFFNG